MSRDPDSVALEAASSIVHAVDHMTFPGGDVQLKAHIQCIVYDAIHRANTPDSAAQGAMGDEKISLWFFRDLTNEQRVKLFRVFGWQGDELATANRGLQRKILKSILGAQPSDATAQPTHWTQEMLDQVADDVERLSKKIVPGRQVDEVAQPRVDLTDERAAFAHELWATAQLLPNEGIEDGVARIVQLLANTAQGKARNFCADCGKRTPEGSIHTCAPAYAVEQADHIVDANKMVDDVLGKATSYEETRQLFIELVSALAAKKG